MLTTVDERKDNFSSGQGGFHNVNILQWYDVNLPPLILGNSSEGMRLRLGDRIELLVIKHAGVQNPQIRFNGSYFNKYYSRYMPNNIPYKAIYSDASDWNNWPTSIGNIKYGYHSDVQFSNEYNVFDFITYFSGVPISLDQKYIQPTPKTDLMDVKLGKDNLFHKEGTGKEE